MEISIILFIILCVVLFSYCSYNNNDEINTITYTPNTNIIIEDKLIDSINIYRRENNLNILLPELTLMNTSEQRVAFLQTQDILSHNGFTSINIGSKSLGEIVGKGYKTELGLFNAYKRSPIHDKIMLGDFLYIGSFTENTYNCVLFAK